MTPFRVEIKLLTPVALSAPFIHFDAIIAHLRALRSAGRDYYSLPTKKVVVVSKEEDYFAFSRGVFHASASIFVNAQMDSAMYYKRFDEFFYMNMREAERTKKIGIGSGFFKSYAMKTVYIAAEKVIFYGCGHIDKISDALQFLTHVGDNTRCGWGRVGEINIYAESEDYSLFKDGLAMRAIPAARVSEAAEIAPLPYKPPYWAKENIDVCVVPFTRCVP